MAHWCRICFRDRPNEKFSGKGHRDHVCKECSRRPKSERDAIDHEREIHGYYNQKNISKKNLMRLKTLSQSSNPTISALANAVFAVGNAKPHKRKRLSFLARNYPDVMEMLGAVGLIIPPAEHRAMPCMVNDFEHDEYESFIFERQMVERHVDELVLSGDNHTDPGEVGRLLLEYTKMVNSET